MAAEGGDGFDRLFETARALGEETRFRIYRRIWLSPRPESVSEIAESFSLHPNAVRQHLTRLEQAGLVTSHPDRPGGAGRPRRLYEPGPVPGDLAHPPGSAAALLAMLSDAMDTLPSDRDQLVRFGRDWARSWAKGRRNGRLPRGRRARAESFVKELAEWGWRPEAVGQNGETRLVTQRCLFHDRAAGEHGRSCALEEGLLQGLSEAALNGQARRISVRGCRLEVTL